MLKFSVKTDGFEELQEAIARACTKAEHIVAVQVEKDTSPYVPFFAPNSTDFVSFPLTIGRT